ncbi:MAG: 2Fe-2S iron-sulfur cluster binding domain-containing protein [Acaryochloridaceae cyanobacterium RL_2_7]|nr:2Fe-2S iron-sulfur cluster binding domain-containing protein [Acaryochloridaceae cyanobacterium RL_2_7]
MSKLIRLEPTGEDIEVMTNTSLLLGLLSEKVDVSQGCGGRGLCATCHVFVRSGMDSLSPMSLREQRTLGVVTSCNGQSRLACQALIQGENIVVEVPSGRYLTERTDIEDLIGRRTQTAILHPLSGQVLVEKRKLITRSMITQLDDIRDKFNQYLQESREI